MITNDNMINDSEYSTETRKYWTSKLDNINQIHLAREDLGRLKLWDTYKYSSTPHKQATGIFT